jgi:hypothetical protein
VDKAVGRRAGRSGEHRGLDGLGAEGGRRNRQDAKAPGGPLEIARTARVAHQAPMNLFARLADVDDASWRLGVLALKDVLHPIALSVRAGA